MSEKPQTITIDDVKYVRADSVNQNAEPLEGMPFVLIRSDRSGVHFGYLRSKVVAGDKWNVDMVHCRRVYYWSGAATLSQLALEGTKKPDECKFPAPVPTMEVAGVIEIIPITASAAANLKGVKVWQL